MFFGCTEPSDSKGTKLWNSNQEAFPSAGKNTGIVLVPRLLMEVHPYSSLWWCGYLYKSVGVICYDRWILSEDHKYYFKNWCLMNSHPTFLSLTNSNLMNYVHIIKSM